MKRLAVGVWLLLLASACGGPTHVAPFTPRKRDYTAGEYAQRAPTARPSAGSLFSEATGGFLEDTRAVRVGDVLAVRIDEASDAQGAASTKLSRDSSGTTGTTAMLGLLPALKKAYPNVDPATLVEFASKSAFAGEGNTARKGVLSGSIAVRVVREMPNGDLFIEGTKVVLINNEEYHLYVSGLVRTADIARDNSIESTRIADAQIEFTGRGDLAEQQRKGWLVRFFDTVNPF